MASDVNQMATDVVEQQATEIFTTTMSPFCPGLLISDCPSGKATELKDEIRQELIGGKDANAIREELQVRFKGSLDARPPTNGFGALVWIVPALLLCIGGILLVRWIKSQVASKNTIV